MALNTQKFLPGSNSKTKSTLAIIPKIKSPLVGIEKSTGKSTFANKNNPLINILNKTVLINKTLEKINGQLVKNKKTQRRKSIASNRKNEETRLEKSEKSKAKNEESGTIKKLSFLDRFKKFLTFTFLGWLFDKTVKYLPKLLKIISLLAPIGEFITKVIGSVGNAAITFIDKGYELWDKFKAWKKDNIDGTNFQKLFDPVINNLETFANLALIAGLLSTVGGGGGGNNRFRKGGGNNRGKGFFRSRGGNKRSFNNKGNGFLKNPFRRKPSITGTGTDRFFRNPLRRRPGTTGGRLDRFKQGAQKLNPFGNKAPVTVSSGTRIQLLKDKIKDLQGNIKKLNNTLSNQAKRISQLTKSGLDAIKAKASPKITQMVSKGKKVVDVTFGAIKNAISKGNFKADQLIELAKPLLGRIVSGGKSSLTSIKSLLRPLLKPIQTPIRSIPFIGALIDFGINTFIFGDSPGEAAFKAAFAGILGAIGGAAGSIAPGPGTFIGATLGGMLGDQIGGWIYNKTIGSGSGEEPKVGELELNQFNKGGTIKEHKDKRKKKQEIEVFNKPLMPPLMGSLRSQKLFPIASERGYQNPQVFLRDSTKTMRRTPYYGHLFNLFGESILGKRMSTRDIDNIGLDIASLISKIFKDQTEKGESWYSIISNLPKLIYDLTNRTLISNANKVVSKLLSESKLKTIYDNELVKKIKILEEKLKEVESKNPNASTGSGSTGSGSTGSGSTSIPTTSLISLGSGGGSLKNMTDQDFSDLAYIVSHEALRNTDDEYAVAASVLNRLTDPRFPDTIMGVGTQRDQYAAVFTGRAYRDPKLAEKLKANQGKIIDALKELDGRTDFKAHSSMGQYMGESDLMFAPGGNFYHYSEQVRKSDPIPKNIPQNWKTLLGKGMKGGGDLVKINEPRSFKLLKEKTSYENSMIILVKREREIVRVPINKGTASRIIVQGNNNSLSPEKFKSFMK